MTPTSLIGHTREALRQLMVELGQPAYRGDQLFTWLYHHGVEGFLEISNLPLALREQLAERFTLRTLTLARREISRDGTEKFLWQLPDGHFIESVLIPEERRTTVCISSQVGCALGCDFCATARMGFLRNLTTGEIVEQILQIRRLAAQYQITNIVFMGMGEPFLNYPRVIQACQILGDPEGGAIARKKLTISTVGIVPRIRQFTRERQPYGLAISLHAPEQELRAQLMPVAHRFSLEELLESAYEYTRSWKRKRITFEYVLLKGLNHHPEHARQLIRILSPIRCKLNLIPCNENDLGYRSPSEEEIEAFVHRLRHAPFTVTVRRNRGQDISAACGQLYARQQAGKMRTLQKETAQ